MALPYRLILPLVLLAQACTPHAYVREGAPVGQNLPEAAPTHSIFLIGDCGKPSTDPVEPSLALLRDVSQAAGQQGTVLFLGDNAYDRGLPPEDHPERAEMERRLRAQTDAVKESGCEVIMIPGNHDWDLMGPKGWEAIQREEAFVEKSLDRGDSFQPDGGCPGPVVRHPAPGITLVILDTQWWLHKHARPGLEHGCAAGNEEEFINALGDSLASHRNDHLIVAAHHPIWTYGTHGGHYGWKYHLFPLLMANKKLYVPLPVVGSLAVWYRKLFGTTQDCSHPKYRRLRREMREIFAAHPGLVYVAGHEHNLQHNHEAGVEYIVSGAGSKAQSVGHGKHSQYANGAKGLARLDFYADSSVVLRFLLPSGGCTVDYEVRLK